MGDDAEIADAGLVHAIGRSLCQNPPFCNKYAKQKRAEARFSKITG
jgi:hypothetical protein